MKKRMFGCRMAISSKGVIQRLEPWNHAVIAVEAGDKTIHRHVCDWFRLDIICNVKTVQAETLYTGRSNKNRTPKRASISRLPFKQKKTDCCMSKSNQFRLCELILLFVFSIYRCILQDSLTTQV